MRRPCKPRAGLTLLELAAALSVIALTLLLAGPAFPRPRSATESAGLTMAQIIGQTLLRAERTGRTLAVDFDVDHLQYHVSAPDASYGDSAIATDTLKISATVKVRSVGANQALRVLLHPLGRADGGPFILEERTTHILEIDPWTGATHVHAQ